MFHPKLLLTVILFMGVNNAKGSNSMASTKVFSKKMNLINKDSELTTKSMNFQSYRTSSAGKIRRRMLTQDKFHSNPQESVKSSGRSINAPEEPTYTESLIVKSMLVKIVLY
jgi:hypothetical protein